MDILRNRLTDSNDSIMSLISASNSENSLVICPLIYGNLARFIAGVNEDSKTSLKKANVN